MIEKRGTRSSVRVNADFRISLPRFARNQLKIKRGDRLIVEVEGNAMFLIPQPKRHVEYLRGVHGEIWKGIDVEKYINKERGSWTIQQKPIKSNKG